MNRFKEKRRTPRIEDKLPLKVMEGDYCTVVETKNISASGVYFTTDKPVPIMSQVIITLLLPLGKDKNKKIKLSGTVVRVVAISSEERELYDTAIFFNDISEKAKGVLSRYVKDVIEAC